MNLQDLCVCVMCGRRVGGARGAGETDWQVTWVLLRSLGFMNGCPSAALLPVAWRCHKMCVNPQCTGVTTPQSTPGDLPERVGMGIGDHSASAGVESLGPPVSSGE